MRILSALAGLRRPNRAGHDAPGQAGEGALGWDTGQANRTIAGYELSLTCFACPEQYDVFRAGERVGYLRLRHGCFRADVPECGGRMVYEAEP